MGIYSEYLERNLDWSELAAERKKELAKISKLRDGRAVLTFASALTKQAPIGIDYDDRVPILDQISNLEGDKIDMILETPGGSAEIVEDIVKQIRYHFNEVAMIIPGYAKSAGTIMAMAADEILMEPASALGPIDAQVKQGSKVFSADAFLKGLEKIKEEVESKGQLNRAYVPILQNISPGEIQNCENLLTFSQSLVTDWLSKYKFKFWKTHSSTNKKVTDKEKKQRAQEIAKILCNHGRWLTHGRSITLIDLREMGLKVTDYSEDKNLDEAISRYYTLLKMTFDTSNIFKVYETVNSQIYRYVTAPGAPTQQQKPEMVEIEFECPNCKTKTLIQVNLKRNIPIKKNATLFPKNNILICPVCKNRNDLSNLRRQIESQTKKKIL